MRAPGNPCPYGSDSDLLGNGSYSEQDRIEKYGCSQAENCTTHDACAAQDLSVNLDQCYQFVVKQLLHSNTLNLIPLRPVLVTAASVRFCIMFAHSAQSRGHARLRKHGASRSVDRCNSKRRTELKNNDYT